MNNETIGSEKEKTTNKFKLNAIIKKLDMFSILVIFPMIFTTILLVKAVFDEEIVPVVVSVFQYVILVIGLLLHKRIISCRKEWIKYLIIMISVVLIPVNISSYTWGSSSFNDNHNALIVTPKVETPLNAQDCLGKKLSDIEDAFCLAGFSQIEIEALEDLEISDGERNETVESISINGEYDFTSDVKYNKYDKVVIKYHSVKFAVLPFSDEEVKNMQTEFVIAELNNIGFSEVVTEEVFDLDPDISGEFENSLSINENTSFAKGDKIPLNATIKIITHKPYDKYTVKIVFDFLSNLMFSTYDIKYEFNGITKTLSHGEDDEFNYRLTPGEYEIILYSAESKSIKNSVKLDVSGDTEAAYRIHCYSDRISIENIYTENKGAVKDGEAMVPLSDQDCNYKNYQDIIKLFETAGFKNISTEIRYDIVLGWTKEGEVADISINGKTDFNRGDIFDENAYIVIAYHMREEDDPNKPTDTSIEQSSTATTKTKQTTEKATEKKESSVYFSTNTRETVYDGNSGVYAYKNKGGSYDIYWIIDFDEGYVYNYFEGNGNEYCDKIEIDYGDLNTYVRITWNDGFDTYKYGLHFNYVSNPNHLVIDDHYGFALDFYPTDLNKALAVRNTKIITKR